MLEESGENEGVLARAGWLRIGGVRFLDLWGHAREAVRLLGWTVEAVRMVD